MQRYAKNQVRIKDIVYTIISWDEGRICVTYKGINGYPKDSCWKHEIPNEVRDRIKQLQNNEEIHPQLINELIDEEKWIDLEEQIQSSMWGMEYNPLRAMDEVIECCGDFFEEVGQSYLKKLLDQVRSNFAEKAHDQLANERK